MSRVILESFFLSIPRKQKSKAIQLENVTLKDANDLTKQLISEVQYMIRRQDKKLERETGQK